ncbi:hypothetical protein FA95DRAFT_1564899 [Auriscalpium vulgare]|uniref:Uncharacterized protein n=1 Tax=Auriscalpium vulgare TaxID=40419 RepID=A0ACB8RCY5_9AGAM|nr:hypothetical protein FA95DRAFT_1564899 [Auriscalpium vulgare]
MASNKSPGPGTVPFQSGAAPKYLNDFSKALASEVRILLQEVGKLRDERRALQHEIAELMAVKAKHSAGGEYSPDWRPKLALPVELLPQEPPPPEDPGPLEPARPAWRTVHKPAPGPPGGRRKGKAAAAPPPPPPAAPVALPDPRTELPSWAQWRPNPHLAPQARTPSNAVVQVPQRAGLFGPVTPPPQ